MPQSDPAAEVTRVLDAWLDTAAAVDDLSVRTISEKPLTAHVRSGPHGRSQLVAVVHDPAVLAWFTDGSRGMRQLVAALATEWGAHVPVDGRCPQCRVEAPCRSRTRMTRMLVADSVGRATRRQGA